MPLSYIKTLVGETAEVIDTKVICEGNYQQAWALLTERFENKKIRSTRATQNKDLIACKTADL